MDINNNMSYQQKITVYDISVVIVSYNTKELTAKCIQSILDLDTSLDIEVIVVDNKSPDDSAHYIKKKFPKIQTIELDGNFGFSYANNIGFEISKGEYILCLNPDTIISIESLENSLAFLKENQDFGTVGVRLENMHGLGEISGMRFLSPLHFLLLAVLPKFLVGQLPLIGDLRYASRKPTDSFACDAIIGCFMMFTRSLYEKVGGFDSRFFMYGEEVEWCWRIRKAGYKIGYLGNCSIIHYDGASTRNASKWKLTAMAKGHILSQAMMRGLPAAKFTTLCMIVGQIVRMPAWLILAIFHSGEALTNNWAKLRFLVSALFSPISKLYRK